MREAALLHGQFLPFAVLEGELFQVGDRVLQLGALSLAPGVLLLRFGTERREALPAAPSVGAGKRQFTGPGVGVEQLALRGRAQQGLVLVLAVDVHQVLAGFPQLRERRGMAVDEAARAAGTVDGPAQYDGVRIAFESGLAEESFERCIV